ncbi:threonine ammonia-lyase IlvA [Propionibacterium cyclohexanicum]|uniref:threonine ammonia-lyase IlvA n=1 Tax=Propionibacterium cyclohexanicum TaxID=64702 RepID=UPI001FDF265E|nr:threonine ammonia-lyase IlvA [Propionibacterium cyclohexanicum]
MSNPVIRELAEQVDRAAQVLADVSVMTPLQLNERLSAAQGARVWIKREDLQPVRSYKLRGAYNFINSLTPVQRAAGVVCASAGNHGQGVAWVCARLGIPGTVCVPTTTPRQKRERIQFFGNGHVKLVVAGDSYDIAAEAARGYSERSGAVMVPAFDAPLTAAGQGTIAREVLEQLGHAPDVIVVPVGGAGLLAGCGAWLRIHCPQTRIVAVEPAGAASLAPALAAGHPVTLTQLDTFVDGAAVARVGDFTYKVCADVDPELVSVPEGRVCQEMLSMYQVDGVIAEPAGALAASALSTADEPNAFRLDPGTDVVIVLSGGNNDVSRYAEVIERAAVHEGRRRYFLVDFPQEPGALRRFLNEVLGPDDDIIVFEYTKHSDRETGPALVGIELGDPRSYPSLWARMISSPLDVEVLEPDTAIYRMLV